MEAEGLKASKEAFFIQNLTHHAVELYPEAQQHWTNRHMSSAMGHMCALLHHVTQTLKVMDCDIMLVSVGRNLHVNQQLRVNKT